MTDLHAALSADLVRRVGRIFHVLDITPGLEDDAAHLAELLTDYERLLPEAGKLYALRRENDKLARMYDAREREVQELLQEQGRWRVAERRVRELCARSCLPREA